MINELSHNFVIKFTDNERNIPSPRSVLGKGVVRDRLGLQPGCSAPVCFFVSKGFVVCSEIVACF